MENLIELLTKTLRDIDARLTALEAVKASTPAPAPAEPDVAVEALRKECVDKMKQLLEAGILDRKQCKVLIAGIGKSKISELTTQEANQLLAKIEELSNG